MIAFSLLTCDCRVTRSNRLERLIWIGEKEKNKKNIIDNARFTLYFEMWSNRISWEQHERNIAKIALLSFCYILRSFFKIRFSCACYLMFNKLKSIERHDIQNYMNLEHDKCHKIKGKFRLSKSDSIVIESISLGMLTQLDCHLNKRIWFTSMIDAINNLCGTGFHIVCRNRRRCGAYLWIVLRMAGSSLRS